MRRYGMLFIEVKKMKIGYARVSTEDQEMASQIELLEKEGCERIYREKVSGANRDREELKQALNMLRKGDMFVVMKLDRLGRTVKQLVELMDWFTEQEIQFKSLQDGIDTTTANGRFFFHIMSAFSELERELIRERTQVGLSSARRRGRLGGRPETHGEDKKEIAYQMVMESHQTVAEIAKAMNMSRATIYRYIEKRRGLALG
tara:strand:- start:1582 stop:2190 length:609 start_codon:yes stop_codon:yes gene_type:complete